MLTRGRARALDIKIDDILEDVKVTENLAKSAQVADHFGENKNLLDQKRKSVKNQIRKSKIKIKRQHFRDSKQ